MVKVATVLKRIIASSPSSFAFLCCLLTITVAYRMQLTMGLFTQTVRPFDFNPTSHGVWFMLSYLPYDVAFVLGCFLIAWLLSQLHRLGGQKASLHLKISGFFLLHTALVALAFLDGLHGRLLFDVQTGVDWSVIQEGLSSISVIGALKFGEMKDWLFILLPVGLFWVILLVPPTVSAWITTLSFAVMTALSSACLWQPHEPRVSVPAEIRLTPALFLLSDVVNQTLHEQAAERPGVTIAHERFPGIKASGPLYVHPVQQIKLLPTQSRQPWNLVLFVMESAGTRYIFDTSHGTPVPMPFLQDLSEKGWYLKKHYTTSNVSTKAVFSILSGLYDLFDRSHVGLRPDASIPSLYHFLAQTHEAFLVTPSSISWYFPVAFVKNSGFPEIHSYEDLNFKIKETYHSLGHYIARDEVQTVDFFIRRMKKAREPFMAMYISFAAHFPYFDYGEEYRIAEDDEHAINRYYNNLRLLDQLIKRVYDHLKAEGLLERTIFAVVGDHGQAFGQHHPDNFMHYRYSYNENLETPVILYQPRLFRPKTFEFATSHVDLLPTLLDAMRTPYDPSQFDGESLFYNPLARKYLFFYGHEESFSLLGSDQIKVQYSLKTKRGWAFDLKNDPGENHPLDCSPYGSQVEALFNFVTHHNSSLLDSNGVIKDQRRVQGRGSPTL